MKTYFIDDPFECVKMSNECLEGHEGLIINICKSTFVETGSLRGFRQDICDKYGIPVAKTGYHGGSIVCFPGDLSFCETHWGPSEFAPEMIEKAVVFLKGKDLEITRDENDILVDGEKVISWARFTTISGWVQSVVHFSINSDLNLIKEICTKQMLKIPGALSKYGITADMLLDYLGYSKEGI